METEASLKFLRLQKQFTGINTILIACSFGMRFVIARNRIWNFVNFRFWWVLMGIWWKCQIKNRKSGLKKLYPGLIAGNFNSLWEMPP